MDSMGAVAAVHGEGYLMAGDDNTALRIGRASWYATSPLLTRSVLRGGSRMPKGVEGSDAGTSGALQYSRGSEFAGSKRFGNEIGNEGGNQQQPNPWSPQF